MKAVLKSETSGMVVTAATLNLPGMEPGSTSTASQGFEAQIAPGTTCGTTLEYGITVESPEGKTAMTDSLFVGKKEFTTGGIDSTSQTIPDSNLSGVVSTISVDAGQKVAIAKVKLDITHDYTADLSVDLISPTGKTIRLFNRKGGINLKTEFMVPVDASPKGDWKLQVIDSIKTDEGTLNSWEISFESYRCES